MTCDICGNKANTNRCWRHKDRKKIGTKKNRGAYKDIYLEHFQYDGINPPICEITGQPLQQVHHILPRGRGGTDDIENLIGLIYPLHDAVENKYPHLNEAYKEAHTLFLETRLPLYITNPELCHYILSHLTTHTDK